ncbi:adenylyltransferase/cytidyltransferase family protein [uncultured Friedmanniella sp.]|uniref:adenylyltransferase/cytidyltransferase family protein n=1 Tax=uncultured Friedmanniella sp. TaxID=335381 RepID=UPI0035C97055
MVVGYLLGTFDMLNIADLDVIAQARSRSSRLVLGVHTDEAARLLAGLPPVVPLEERLTLLRHVRGVDEVVVHEQTEAAASAAAVFTVRADDGGPDAELLTPRRVSTSAVLRRALEPGAAEDVA